MKNCKCYSEYAEKANVAEKVSLEELEERIEQDAREEEADNIVLAEDRRVSD